MAEILLPGTATPAQVLSGATFSAGSNFDTPGAMPNNGANGFTPSGSAPITIPVGYYNGSGQVAQVTVPTGSVLNTATIAGVQGTMLTKVGSNTVFSPSTAVQPVLQGYYDGTTSSGEVAAVTGTATTTQVLNGYSFSSASGITQWGSMLGPFNPSTTLVAGGTVQAGCYTAGTIPSTLSATSSITATQISSGAANWLVPNGVSEIIVELWGGGGGSGYLAGDAYPNGGGGGGAYVRATISSLIPGNNLAYSVGTGSCMANGNPTTFGNPGVNQVTAPGGTAGGSGGSGVSGPGGPGGGTGGGAGGTGADWEIGGSGVAYSPTFTGATVLLAIGGGGGGQGGWATVGGQGGAGGSGGAGGAGGTANQNGNPGGAGGGGGGGSGGCYYGGGGGGYFAATGTGLSATGGGGAIIIYYPTPVSSGTATNQQVLTGYTFGNNAGVNIPGSMPNASYATAVTPTTSTQAIANGWHSGTGNDYVVGDANLTAANIAKGTSIFGVAGSLDGIKSIQQVTVTIAASQTSGTATITSVVPGNTILIPCGLQGSMSGGNVIDEDFASYAVLTNATTITTTRYATSSYTSSMQLIVLEFQAGAVKTAAQAGSIAWTGGTGTATLTNAVTTTKYLLICTGSITETTNTLGAVCYFSTLKLTASTTVTANSGFGSGYNWVIYFNIIELN